MKKAPGFYNVENLPNWDNIVLIKNRWVFSRPLGMFGLLSRLRAAWMVFTGKADVLIWQEGQ